MDFDTQLFIAALVAGTIGTALDIKLTRQYKRQGKSIKYLQYQIGFFVVTPIMAIPAFLSDVIPLWMKVVGLIAVIIVSGLQLAAETSARRSFRKIFGLSPEDDDTGEVIKKDERDKK